MKDKGHFTISLIKSLMRITAYAGAAQAEPKLLIAMIALAAAEVLGILEELVDKR